jgi:helicase
MLADDIIAFLEESFAAFLNKHQNANWGWDRASLNNALGDLIQHELVEGDVNNLFHLTELGRLVGVTGTEVESVIRVVGVLQSLQSSEVSDPTLLTVTQLTVELDDVLFPINKVSTKKEPQAWNTELRQQGIPESVLHSIQRFAREKHFPTLRAKKAAACLMWITGMPMAQISLRSRSLEEVSGEQPARCGP